MNPDVFVESILDGRFSRYKERLGSGAYKTVFKGYDHENGIEVAWNQIKFERLKQTERDRLNDEIRILQVIEHPNIIKLYQFYVDEEKKRLVILTELMTSGTLRQFVLKSRQPTKLKVIKRWCTQILKGLSYLHSQNIIHRDLKCDNIFINGSMGEVKIGDLGLSTTMHARTHAESVIGTPEFMAPEFYDEYYTEKVDTYAFGMCLLEMVTQEYPYSECTNAAQIYKKVTGGRPPAALLRIEDCDVRQFIELCLGSLEDRPSPSELLDHNFFIIDVPSNSDAVQMRPRDPELKALNTGVVDGPAAPSSNSSQPSPTPREPNASRIAPAVSGSSTSTSAASQTQPRTNGVPGVSSAPVPAPEPTPAEEEDTKATQNVPPVSRASGTEGNPHTFHVAGTDDQSGVTPTGAGEQEIKLQLTIGEVVKEVSFPFNVVTDTAAEVAREMVADLKLTCEISWLTAQLQERVNDIASAMEDRSGVPQAASPHDRKPAGGPTAHPTAHDSPRIVARTVPKSDIQPTDETQPQAGPNGWRVAPIDISQPAIPKPSESLDDRGSNNDLSSLEGSPTKTGIQEQPPEDPAGRAHRDPSPMSLEEPADLPPSTDVTRVDSTGSLVEQQPKETSPEPSPGTGTPGVKEEEPDEIVDIQAQELALLEELNELDNQISVLNRQVLDLNKTRGLKFEQLQAVRSKAQEKHKAEKKKSVSPSDVERSDGEVVELVSPAPGPAPHAAAPEQPPAPAPAPQGTAPTPAPAQAPAAPTPASAPAPATQPQAPTPSQPGSGGNDPPPAYTPAPVPPPAQESLPTSQDAAPGEASLEGSSGEHSRRGSSKGDSDHVNASMAKHLEAFKTQKGSQQAPGQGSQPAPGQGSQPAPGQLGAQQGMQHQGMQGMQQGMPAQQQGMPVQQQGMPQAMQPQQGMPVQQGMPQQGMPAQQGMQSMQPQQGMPQGMQPQQGMTQGMPAQQQGMPVQQQGMPVQKQGMQAQQSGMQQAMQPQQGVPQAMPPQQGIPPQKQGLSQAMPPQQGMQQARAQGLVGSQGMHAPLQPMQSQHTSIPSQQMPQAPAVVPQQPS